MTQTFLVYVTTPGAGTDQVYVEARGPQQAKDFAEARYPGCRIGGAVRQN